jgi:hypothetical protein
LTCSDQLHTPMANASIAMTTSYGESVQCSVFSVQCSDSEH